MSTRSRLLTLVLALLLTSTAHAEQPLPDQSDRATWTTDGLVSSVVTIGSTTYLSGAFTYVGPPTGSALFVDPADGEPTAAHLDVAGFVLASAGDGHGGVYLSGYLQAVDGVPVRTDAIVHVTADGSVDPGFHSPEFTSSVGDPFTDALLRVGDRLYVGGGFDHVGGAAHASLVALDATTGSALDANLDARSGADLGEVAALALTPAGHVIVGGTFTTLGGKTRGYLADIGVDGTVSDMNFANQFPDQPVYAVATTADWVYIGGAFNQVGQSTGGRLRRYHADGTLDLTWKPSAIDGAVLDIAPTAGRVYFAGPFASAENTQRHSTAAVSSSGTGVLTAWNPDVGGGPGGAAARVYTVLVRGGEVYLGGRFTKVGADQARDNLAIVDASSGTLVRSSISVGGTVSQLVDLGGVVFAGGTFTSYGGVDRRSLAALGPDGTATTWNPDADGAVSSMVASPDATRLYIGGSFTHVGGAPRGRVAALAPPSDVPLDFDPKADAAVDSLAVAADGSTLYVGGTFANIGGAARTHLGAIDTGSGAATAFDPHPDGDVHGVELDRDRLLVRGDFAHLGAQAAQPARTGIGAVSLATGDATDLAPLVLGGPVWATRQVGDTTYLGGSFTAINGTQRLGAAALGANALTAFDPSPGARVWALAPTSGGSLLIGGEFDALAGTPRGHLAEVDPATGAVGPWHPTLTYPVTGVWPSGRDVWVAGGYTDGTAPGGYLHRYVRPADPSGQGGVSSGGAAPGGPPADTTPPHVLSASLTRARFAVAAARTAVSATARGTTLRASFDEPASVTVAVSRLASGRRVGSRCAAPSRRLAERRRCTRVIAVGTLSRSARAAVLRLGFSGRIGRTPLAPGRYRLALVARDAAGNRSAARTIAFRVVKG